MPQLEIKTVQQRENNGVSKWGIRIGENKRGREVKISPDRVLWDDIYGRRSEKGAN